MAYDEDLADRIRTQVGAGRNVREQKMFGGLAFLIGGHMAVAAGGHGGLMVRCDPEQTDTFVAQPLAARMEMQGRRMNGWLRIDRVGVESDDDLARWVAVGVEFARSLPPK